MGRSTTMAECIEREALITKFKQMGLGKHGLVERLFADGVYAVIAAFPAADVAPVVHGRWIRPHWKNNNYCCDCSECGGEAMHRDYQWNKNGVYPICPNCGAKMDGGADNDA
jgi:hypothetical protein